MCKACDLENLNFTHKFISVGITDLDQNAIIKSLIININKHIYYLSLHQSLFFGMVFSVDYEVVSDKGGI